MHFSTFTAYFATCNAPAAIKASVKRRAIARYTERVQAGRADCELLFNDLIEELETAIA